MIGRWSCSEERGSLIVDITRDGDAGHLTLASAEKGEQPKTEEARLVTARVERMTFASVGGGEAGKEDWNLVRYELHGADRMSIYLDNGRFWTDAVRNKMVSGELVKGDFGTSTRVTASSEEMRKVVLGYGGVIFEETAACEFTRQ